MLLSVPVHSFIFGTIGPLLDAFAVLLVLEPLAHVSSSICVLVGAISMGLIIEPLAFVDVAVSVNESSESIGLVSLPLAIVLGPILPDLLAVPVLHSLEQFAGVNRPIT